MASFRPSLRSIAPVCCALAALISAAGCRDKPQELAPPPVTTAAAQQAVAPLVYEIPGTWTRMSESATSPKRAVIKVPKAGADTEDAELNVFFFGTGSQGDPDKTFKAWFEQFDGNAAATADRQSFDSPAGKVDSIEVFGTYKVALGPPVGPNKKSPMQMVKDKWRLYAAVVHTRERGNWFFKLVGPDETVQAARNALRTSLEAAR
jgi:hypothetical protein